MRARRPGSITPPRKKLKNPRKNLSRWSLPKPPPKRLPQNNTKPASNANLIKFAKAVFFPSREKGSFFLPACWGEPQSPISGSRPAARFPENAIQLSSCNLRDPWPSKSGFLINSPRKTQHLMSCCPKNVAPGADSKDSPCFFDQFLYNGLWKVISFCDPHFVQ